MSKGLEKFSIMVGGGQDYWGPTADRDRHVVRELALGLSLEAQKRGFQIQIITGGMPGIGDDFASYYHGTVLDVVSDEHLPSYKERTKHQNHRSYWVAGKTQEQRRLAFATNPDISLGLFIQGGKYTTHEIKIFMESNKPVVLFWGSGGASGGYQPYEGWTCPKPTDHHDAPYMSDDPDLDPRIIAKSLIDQIIQHLKAVK